MTDRMESYHNRIMNIATESAERDDYDSRTYTEGHSHARYAAAEIAVEADTRIAELEAQAEAAERNIGVLLKQLANCHETMKKDGVRHAKLLLAVEDDQADAARLRAALEKVEWVYHDAGYAECLWCHATPEEKHTTSCQRQVALRTDEQPAESEEK